MGATYWSKCIRATTLKDIKSKWRRLALRNRSKLLDLALKDIAKENREQYCKYNPRKCQHKHVNFNALHVYKSFKQKLLNQPSYVVPHGVVFKGKDRQYYEATKHGKWKRITLQSDVVSDHLIYIGQPSIWTKEKPNQWSPFPRGMMAGSYAIEFQLSKQFHTIKEANDYILSVHKKWTPGIAVRVGKNKVVIGGLCAQ